MPSPNNKVKQKTATEQQQSSTKHKLWQSTAVVSAMTLLSRLLGFVRDMVLANLFGTGSTFDAFVIAFKIPNFFRRLFAEGAFSQAFVPTFTDHCNTHQRSASRLFAQRIAGVLGLSLGLFVAIAEVASPVFISIFAPGFTHDPQRFALATHLLHITFPYIILISFTALAGGILNSRRKFAVPAFTPVLLNLSLITAAYFWAPHSSHPISTIAWAVIIGGVLQLALQIPFLIREKLLPTPRLCWNDPGVRRVLRLMVPALFGVSVAQISLMIDNIFASYLPSGSISWLYYSDRLTYLPLGVIGVALATVILPHLSRLHSNSSTKEFKQTCHWAIRNVLLIGIPATLGLALLASGLLSTLFQHGAFNQHSVIMSSRSLVAFAIGLPAFMLIKILASSFYAQKNIRTPVIIACWALLLNLALNFLLIKPLAHAGLALATSIAAWLNAGLLFYKLSKNMPSQASDKASLKASPSSKDEKNKYSAKSWLIFSFRLIISCLAMGVFVYYFNPSVEQWGAWHSMQRITHLTIILSTAIAIYFASLAILGLRRSDLKAPPEETIK